MPPQGRLGLYGCSSDNYLCEVRLSYLCEMRLEFLGSNAGVDNTLANQRVTFRATHIQFHRMGGHSLSSAFRPPPAVFQIGS